MQDMAERLATCFLSFENRPVRFLALKEMQSLRLEGATVGPYEENGEYEERFWVAEQLQREGLVTISRSEFLDFNLLSRTHWSEMMQSSKQLSSLPEGFYAKLRKYLSEVETKAHGDPRELPRLEKSKQLATDVLERRLRRITTMASGPPISNSLLKPLAEEEHLLYDAIRAVIEAWRSAILSTGTKEGGT